jgi:CheY-like chemotaxis protein
MSPKKVLIADDDPTLVRILEVRLRRLGFEVRSTHDAMHALTCIHRDPPDLIIMDIAMPAGDGLAACDMLAHDRRLRDIPIIVMSGRADTETRSRCQSLGTDFVLKTGDLWTGLKPMVLRRLNLEEQLV